MDKFEYETSLILAGMKGGKRKNVDDIFQITSPTVKEKSVKYFYTPLHLNFMESKFFSCCKKNMLVEVYVMVNELHFDVNFCPILEGYSLLYELIMQPNYVPYDVIIYIIEQGADINWTLGNSITNLLISASSKRPFDAKIVDILLSFGVNCKEKNRYGMTFFDYIPIEFQCCYMIYSG
jgi:hypothetical protein